MIGMLWIGGIALVLVVLWLASKGKVGHGAGEGAWPFYAKPLLSDPEQALYWRLLKALPDHVVLAQVALSSALGVKKGFEFQTWHNRISRKSADFVVCNKDASILAVIELDDATHGHSRRRQADADKDKALASAGVRVIRWQAAALPDEAAIRETLLPARPQSTPLPSFSATR